MPRLLYDYLRANNPTLCDELDQIRKEADEIWKEQHLREFTVHGADHFSQVEANLDALAAPLQQHPTPSHPLSAEEVFVLLSACYLHDIGMQLGEKDARENHAQYAYDLILYSHARVDTDERRVTLSIRDQAAREAIAHIARGHWTDFALELEEEDYIYGQVRGRLRLLGVLLATADLLDTSAVRGSYYRSTHRLYDLPPVSEMHQSMHRWVRGYRILAPDPSLPSQLLYELEWRDRSDVVQDLAEWQIRWFTSQIRQLKGPLENLTRGAVRWASPWARLVFKEPVGPRHVMTAPALGELNFAVSEQRRIDRHSFSEAFNKALRERNSKLFWLTGGSDSDGTRLLGWCRAVAAVQSGTHVANLSVAPSLPKDLPGLIAEIMEQWGEHLPESTEDSAKASLDCALCNIGEEASVVTVTADQIDDTLLSLLGRLSTVDTVAPGARIVVVLAGSDMAEPPTHDTEIEQFHLGPLPRSEVDDYLERTMGYRDPVDRNGLLDRMTPLKILDNAGMMYHYLKDHCDREAWAVCLP